MNRAGSSWNSKLVLSVLWANFFALWYRVYRVTTASDVAESFNYLGGIAAVYGVFVTWWVYHNIRIYKKKGPRSSVRNVEFSGTHDHLKQYITRKADLKREQEIRVEVVGDRKLFIHNSLSPQEPAIAGSR